ARAGLVPTDETTARPRFLQRLFGRGSHANSQRDDKPDEGWAKVSQLVDSILMGYQMSLERLHRTLVQFGLEAIPSEGLSFDPEMMEVVDAVAGTGLPAGEVV